MFLYKVPKVPLVEALKIAFNSLLLLSLQINKMKSVQQASSPKQELKLLFTRGHKPGSCSLNQIKDRKSRTSCSFNIFKQEGGLSLGVLHSSPLALKISKLVAKPGLCLDGKIINSDSNIVFNSADRQCCVSLPY